ncbi:hypothetical protein FRC19_011867 [Serendipita sp. 401]|nr:hypothetical protein FRC19_011867 [Serendipita sp. 401]
MTSPPSRKNGIFLKRERKDDDHHCISNLLTKSKSGRQSQTLTSPRSNKTRDRILHPADGHGYGSQHPSEDLLSSRHSDTRAQIQGALGTRAGSQTYPSTPLLQIPQVPSTSSLVLRSRRRPLTGPSRSTNDLVNVEADEDDASCPGVSGGGGGGGGGGGDGGIYIDICPEDVLVVIFDYVVYQAVDPALVYDQTTTIRASRARFHAALTLSHVSSEWRAIAIGYSPLWSDVHVCVDRGLSPIQTFCETMLPRLERAGRVNVCFYFGGGFIPFPDDIYRAMGVYRQVWSIPNLRGVVFDIPTRYSATINILYSPDPTTTLSGNAGMASVTRLVLPPSTPFTTWLMISQACPQVTNITGGTSELMQVLVYWRICPRHFGIISPPFPQLQELGLCLEIFLDDLSALRDARCVSSRAPEGSYGSQDRALVHPLCRLTLSWMVMPTQELLDLWRMELGINDTPCLETVWPNGWTVEWHHAVKVAM